MYSLGNTNGFLGQMFDADNLREMLASAGGGAAHSFADGLIASNVGFFSSGSDTMQFLKRLGLSAVLGVGGAAALWQMNEDMAKGALGGFGASAARLVAGQAGVDLGGRPRLAGARRRRLAGGARRSLSASRVTRTGPVQAPLDAVNVQEQDRMTAALSSIY